MARRPSSLYQYDQPVPVDRTCIKLVSDTVHRRRVRRKVEIRFRCISTTPSAISTLYTGRLWYRKRIYVRPSSKFHPSQALGKENRRTNYEETHVFQMDDDRDGLERLGRLELLPKFEKIKEIRQG